MKTNVSKKQNVKHEQSNLDLETNARLLYDIIRKRKALEKKELELKEYFKGLLEDESKIECADFIIYKTYGHRTDLDKAKLKYVLGPNYKLYEIITNYTKLEIKKME